MDKTENRRKFIISVVYFTILLGIFYLIMKYAIGLIMPFIIATLIAVILQRPVNFIHKKIKHGRGFISTLSVLFLFGILVAIIVLLSSRIFEEVKGFWSFLVEQFKSLPTLLESLKAWAIEKSKLLPNSVADTIVEYINNISASFTKNTPDSAGLGNLSSLYSMISNTLGATVSAMSKVPSVLMSTIVTIIASCFFTADYDTLMGFIKRQIKSDQLEKFSRAKKVVATSLKKLCKAYGIIILITTAELSLGLSILKLLKIYNSGYIFLNAFCTALIDIIPVLGTGLILIPWAVVSLIFGDTSLGIGLLIIYAIITVIRQVIEPKIVAGQFEMPAFATIVSMYIGVKLFGALGIIILPLTVIIIKMLADEGIITAIHTKKGDETAEKEEAVMLTKEEEEKTAEQEETVIQTEEGDDTAEKEEAVSE